MPFELKKFPHSSSFFGFNSTRNFAYAIACHTIQYLNANVEFLKMIGELKETYQQYIDEVNAALNIKLDMLFKKYHFTEIKINKRRLCFFESVEFKESDKTIINAAILGDVLPKTKLDDLHCYAVNIAGSHIATSLMHKLTEMGFSEILCDKMKTPDNSHEKIVGFIIQTLIDIFTEDFLIQQLKTFETHMVALQKKIKDNQHDFTLGKKENGVRPGYGVER